MSVDLSELEEKLVKGGEAEDFEEAEGIVKGMGEQKMSKGLSTSIGTLGASVVTYFGGMAGVGITSSLPYLVMMGVGTAGMVGSLLSTIYHMEERHPKRMLKVDESLYEGKEATVDEVFRNYQERK